MKTKDAFVFRVRGSELKYAQQCVDDSNGRRLRACSQLFDIYAAPSLFSAMS